MLPRPKNFTDWWRWAEELVRQIGPEKLPKQLASVLEQGPGITLGYNTSKNTITLSATGEATDLGYTAATRVLTSSNGTDVTLPLVTSTDAGLAPATGGGTSNFLRADGAWAAPASGATDLTYTASTRLLESSTGADVTLPLVTSTDAGLAPASGGGTTNFLRADGTWAAPAGGGSGARERAFVTPTLTDFTQVNGTGATFTQRAYGISIAKDRTASNSIALLSVAAPATPYTVTTAWQLLTRRNQFMGIGVGVRNSSDAKIQILKHLISVSTAPSCSVENYTNPTTFSAAAIAATGFEFITATIWLRVSDDGTNRTWHISPNGDDWIQFGSVLRTSHVTPDEICVGIDANSSSAGLGLLATLLSWEVT